MLGHYYFDLPFYGRLLAPVAVVDDWSSADVGRRDNWRKELADAGHFASAGAAGALIEPAALAARLCASPVSWVIGSSGDIARHPFLAHAQVALTRGATTLWRVDRAGAAMNKELPCPQASPADAGAVTLLPVAARAAWPA